MSTLAFIAGAIFGGTLGILIMALCRIAASKSRKRGGTYISGPMTGLPDFNRVAFLAAEKALRDLGHEPVNPVYNGVPDKAPWHEHMRADIKMLMDCDVIVMLPGWMDSKGAKLEQCIAHWLGMRVVTLEQLRAEGRAA